MGTLNQPHPVKLIVGVLMASDSWSHTVQDALESNLGAIDLASRIMPFNKTDYYAEELGTTPFRQFFSLKKRHMPDELAAIKLKTNQLEKDLAAKSELPRPVNLDPAYVDFSKLVLASTKDFSHRIYLANGIYAEITLQYRKGKWYALPWTFPDFAEERYHSFFTQVRTLIEKPHKA